MSSGEYLTIDEVAARLKVSPKTIKNKMTSGIFRKGVHYFSPKGLRPRFKWSAVQAWLEGTDEVPHQKGETFSAPHFPLPDFEDEAEIVTLFA